MKQYVPLPDEADDNVFWVTMTDLLLGLLIIFIALFAITIVGITSKKVQEVQQNQKIIEQIKNELAQKNIKVDTDLTSGIIKISDLELFEVGNSELSDKGKQFLNKFIPIYFDSLLKKKEIKEKIDKIIIEGHTDTQTYKNVTSEEENYLRNMELSLKRAQSIAHYIIKQNLISNEYKKYLYQVLVIDGKSYSEPVYINNKIDFNKSRRVEFKIMHKNSSIINMIKKNNINQKDIK